MPPADSHPTRVPWLGTGEARGPLAEQVAVGVVLHRPPTPNRFAGAGGVESELHLNKLNLFHFRDDGWRDGENALRNFYLNFITYGNRSVRTVRNI